MSAHDARTRPLARGRGPGPVPPRQMSRHSRKSSSRHIKAIKSVFEISVNARACSAFVVWPISCSVLLCFSPFASETGLATPSEASVWVEFPRIATPDVV